METAGPASEAEKPLVALRHVSKLFSNGTQALADLSLDVFPGEFLSLLGPSGCGKSTALRIIAGLGAPTSGTVSRPDADLGFVFQEPTLMPWRTVFGNVALPLRLKRVSRAETRERAMEALAAVGLAGFAEAYPRELSGGMKMRVSIARALVTRPKLLLMDEPFAALDEITRNRLNDDVLRLWDRARLTVVFVTHSVQEAVYLSTRTVVMAARPGRVVADIAPATSYPRDESFRHTPAYARLAAEVSGALRVAMGEAPV